MKQERNYCKESYASFEEFLPFYFSQHKSRINKKLHFVGTTGALLCFIIFFITFNFYFFISAFIFGYGCAWIGHFFIEKNKPATFKFPFYSFIGDFVMAKEVAFGNIDKVFDDLGITQIE